MTIAPAPDSLGIKRLFTKGMNGTPFENCNWKQMDAWPDHPAYFVPKIRCPNSWSQNRLNIVSKLYLSKSQDTPELDIQVLIERVCQKIAVSALQKGYFAAMPIDTVEKGEFWITNDLLDTSSGRRQYMDWLRTDHPEHPAIIFYDELCYLTLHGYGAFNSPVWFNVGRDDRDQQVSACFILGQDDSTESLLENQQREIKIFRGGSGAGMSVGRVRGSREGLSGGGTASGPVSFMRAYDAWAGTIKSGGKTRRAAKMVSIDVDHPDVYDFIDSKLREEDRLRTLAESGMNIGFDEEGERNVAECTSFQNANNSIAVTDEFMSLAISGQNRPNWSLLNRVDGKPSSRVVASDLFRHIAKAAWTCADPGLHYIDHMNSMHTTPMIDGEPSPIRSTNPCGEYMSNDDTSCNLASLNLLKFLEGANGFNTLKFEQAVDVFITAMDILVSFAYYPDEKIGNNTRLLRQLGLGYANMGASIMAQGWAYDSDEGRNFAASVTALMTGRAYRQSAIVAGALEPFHYFEENRRSMLEVIERHQSHLPPGMSGLWPAARQSWGEAIDHGVVNGYRNAQATVIAPTGTISFLMDCDTTGIEPGYQLVQYKELAGGGSMVLVNRSVHLGLQALDYTEGQIAQLEAMLKDGDVEGFMNQLAREDRPVFAGANEINAKGHIDMMAAVQPFISGAISKTINMPEDALVEDVEWAYRYAWEVGCKDIAIYRDQSKVRQVLGSAPKKEKQDSQTFIENVTVNVNEAWEDLLPSELVEEVVAAGGLASYLEQLKKPAYEKPTLTPIEILERRRMPRTGDAKRHKIHIRSSLGENEGYILVGQYADGTPGEIFLEGFGKHGGFTQNAMSVAATMISIMLQYGIPLEVIVRKIAWVADETGGIVVPGDEPPVIREAKSIVDYIARWLIGTYGTIDQAEEFGVMTDDVKARKVAQLDAQQAVIGVDHTTELDITIMRQSDLTPSASNSGATATMVPLKMREAGSGPACTVCGTRMQRTGSCHTCPSCGTTTGCG